MSPTPLVVLIDSSALTREGMADVLIASADFRVRAISGIHDGSLPPDTDVVILNIKSFRPTHPSVQRQVRIIKNLRKNAVLLAVGEQEGSAMVAAEAILEGLCGYLPITASTDLLIAAIRLIAAGGLFMMPEAIRECIGCFLVANGEPRHPIQ